MCVCVCRVWTQLQVAVELGKPIVLHIREAETDALEIMTSLIPPDHKVHVHCYTGNAANGRLAAIQNELLLLLCRLLLFVLRVSGQFGWWVGWCGHFVVALSMPRCVGLTRLVSWLCCHPARAMLAAFPNLYVCSTAPPHRRVCPPCYAANVCRCCPAPFTLVSIHPLLFLCFVFCVLFFLFLCLLRLWSAFGVRGWCGGVHCMQVHWHHGRGNVCWRPPHSPRPQLRRHPFVAARLGNGRPLHDAKQRLRWCRCWCWCWCWVRFGWQAQARWSTHERGVPPRPHSGDRLRCGALFGWGGWRG